MSKNQIEYVEIRAKDTRQVIGILDTAKSIIWKAEYSGVGEFEIYITATPEHVEMLKEDNYVTRPDRDECGIIEKIEKTTDPRDGAMIAVSGYFAKSILNRRVIYNATLKGTGYNYYWSCNASILSGNVETAVRNLIYTNAINASDANRNITEIYWTDDDITGLSETIIIDATEETTENAEKQVTYKYLQEYSDSVLQEYGLGSKMWLDRDLLKFRYKIYKGVDRSRNNTGGNIPLIFSQEFDNLAESNYTFDKSEYKTTALIGGEGEGTERKCAFSYAWIAGLERRETFVDASDQTQEEQTIETYRKQLEARGQQTISELKPVETFDGTLDITNSNYIYREDYDLGDIVTIEDKQIGKYIDTRIISVTEVQDDDGYNIDIEYGV